MSAYQISPGDAVEVAGLLGVVESVDDDGRAVVRVEVHVEDLTFVSRER